MSAPENNGPEAESTGNPVKEMFLLAALYLPLGFFLWFSFGSALMWPAGRLVGGLLTGVYPEVFEAVVQFGKSFEVQTHVQLERLIEGRVALVTFDVNPMIYAWGMALLFGLVMATPLEGRRRLLQLAIGFAVISLVTAWGVFWNTWMILAFNAGAEGAAAVTVSGLSPTLIALCYQLGYLMLPAVVPVATWILMNRPFLEQIAFGRRT
ncbi:MAG: exosortase H-associated membrane protein [Wenzhouxiangellaceae bacterium]|nr:exosortase H-associated membrane protein [Wenzhouxiangellaceae bacterium]